MPSTRCRVAAQASTSSHALRRRRATSDQTGGSSQLPLLDCRRLLMTDPNSCRLRASTLDLGLQARDGSVSFHLQNATKDGRAVHEWGASVFHSSILQAEKTCVLQLSVALSSPSLELSLALAPLVFSSPPLHPPLPSRSPSPSPPYPSAPLAFPPPPKSSLPLIPASEGGAAHPVVRKPHTRAAVHTRIFHTTVVPDLSTSCLLV